MSELRYTLVTEGSSDVALIPILTWLLRENGIQLVQAEWADLGESRVSERVSLSWKVREAVRLYPCDLLFVHRDADRASVDTRKREIYTAADGLGSLPVICVIPVRMQEAWLLFDEEAIRHAAGNGNGRMPLNLPPLRQVERLPDPKTVLHDCLKTASNLSGRRLKKFNVSQRARRVTEFIEDFSLLRNLPAFATLEQDLQEIIESNGWRLA